MRYVNLLVGLAVAALAVGCAAAPAAQQPAQRTSQQQAGAPPAAAPYTAPQQPAKPAEAQQPPPQAAPPKAEAKPVAPAPEQKLRLAFGSGPIGTGTYLYAVTAAKLWASKVPQVEVSNVATGGALEQLRRMDKNEVQFSHITTDLAYLTWNGLEDYKDKPIQSHRLLYMYSVAPQGWMVRKDTNISKMEELDGKDFNPGTKGSASEKQTMNVMSVLGIKPKYYSAGGEDMIQAAKDRRIVGFTKAHAAARAVDAAIQEVNVTTPLRMLGLSPEQEKAVVDKFPYYTFMSVEKDQLARGMPEQTVRAIAVAIGVAVHKDVPEDIAYKLAKITIEDNSAKGEQTQASAYPAVKGADFAQLTVEHTVTPMHPGTIRYLKEIGRQVNSNQMPPGMK